MRGFFLLFKNFDKFLKFVRIKLFKGETMKKLMIMCLFLTFGVTESKAGLLLEPYVGYLLGTQDGKYKQDGNEVDPDETSSSGAGFGARVGFQTFGLMVGGVYETIPSITSEENDVESDAGSTSRLGVFVGYDFPLFLRVWGTYFLDVSIEDSNGNDASDMFDSGLGAGVGLTFLPLVSLNVEYRMYTLSDDFKNNGVTFDYSDTNYSEIFVSVSLPLNL